MKLPRSFYTRDDVVLIARELLGKYLFTNFNGTITGGYITETEAYEGITDRASHAYSGRRSKRTEVMYMKGGTAYVYLCYGIHSLFNIVTNKPGIPHAVLIRGVHPVKGIDEILKRTRRDNFSPGLTNGPGKVTKALGIHFSHTGCDLCGNKIWLEDNGKKVSQEDIIITRRIGIDYAGDDALLPYRFLIK